MVILKEIFDLLSQGEFANIAVSRSSTGELAEKDYPKIIGHLNLGIVEIHKRFNLLQKDLTLYLNADVSRYYLRPEKVGPLNHMCDRVYILKPETFEEQDGFLNIVRPLCAYDEFNEEIEFNNRYATPNIQISGFDSLKITGHTNQVITIEYQSWPEKVVIDDFFDPEEIAITMSEVAVEPLLYYIASRTYKPMGSNDSTANADKSAAYDAKYELALQKMELYGLDQQHNDNEDTFLARGWA